MSALVHLVPGPEDHGVVRHALGVHPHLGRPETGAGAPEGAELARCQLLDELPEGTLAGRVVVAQLTDRLIATDPGQRLPAWRRAIRGAARVTVVLHDLPQRSDGSARAMRTALYAAIAAEADEVVVASHHERLLLAAVLRHERPRSAAAVLARTHVIPLPVERSEHEPSPVQDRDEGEPLSVVTLGYLYPGKGVEDVVDAAALAARDPRLAGRQVEVRNLGRASDGHDDLVSSLTARAEAAGIRWSTTGWVDDEELPGLLAAATVPVAAHRHVSASGSITSWLAAGRRPLLLRSRYAVELASRLPRAVTLVGGTTTDHPVAVLATAIADALAEPGTTWLEEGVEIGPSWAQAGQRLSDLAARPAVSVVVPYYRDQELLDLILRRLTAQEGVAGGLEVVVGDDGSPLAPTVPEGVAQVLPVQVVRQHRDGFRAAAARNLAARQAAGRVLLFLDGDTVPDDGYVAALQQVCLQSPTLAVGRRRHTERLPVRELSGRSWPPNDDLTDPAWLTEAYRASDDLRRADDGSFRHVISAVLAVSRTVWDAVGGFTELRGYGGEDWELAWRAWLAGVDLRHVPAAVAWHDGPDLAGRPDGQDTARLATVKNDETARLAPLLPHPLVRGRGWTHAWPDVVAVLHADGWTDGQVVVALEALLRHGDVGVWVLDRAGAAAADGAGLPGAVLTDPRVHRGAPPADALVRARALLQLHRPVAVQRLPWAPWPHDLSGDLEACAELTTDRASGVRVVGTRHTGRERLHGGRRRDRWLPTTWVEDLDRDVIVERWRQQHG